MKKRWPILLCVPAVLLALSSASSRAQTLPTPNATIVALQTRAAGLEGQLPDLKATEQAARDQAARASAVATQSAGAVQQTQSDINDTHAEIQAGYGQQALELAGRSQDSLAAAQATLIAAGQQIDLASGALDQSAAAYRTAVPALAATAQHAVQQAADVVPSVQAQAEDQLVSLSERYQSERTIERIAFGVVLVVAAIIVYRLARSRKSAEPQSTPPAGPSDAAPLKDRERLPSQPVEFVDNEELGEYFDQIDHS